jgi:hypothetical protein
VVAAVGVGGVAYAVTGSSTAHTPAAHASHPHLRGLLRRADYAAIEVKVKGTWVTYDFDRGKVTAGSSTSVTLLRPDGVSVTETITPSTRFRGISNASELTVGRSARVISVGGTALRIAERRAASTTTG